MNKFLHIRSRILQFFILFFVVITFYTYYRTTIDQFPPIIISNTSHSPLIHQHHSSDNDINDSPSLSSKNMVLEISTLNLNYSSIQNSNTLLTESISLSSSSKPQSSSSLNNNTINNNNNDTNNINNNNLFKNISKLSSSNVNVNINGTIIINNSNSIRAIYQSGHDITASDKCQNNGKNMNLVIIIMSAPSHIDARTSIRHTWGHFGLRTDVSILFMLGSTNNIKLEKILKKEQELYTDIIRGRFIDSYANLTLKTISALEWVNNYCSNVKFLLKTDDDMFINVPRLLLFIKKHENDKNVIFGRLARKWKPIRNKKSKYYVSIEQFKLQMYPDFTTGPAYLLPQNIIKKLYETSLNQTYLKLEDVFMTGIVANQIGIKRIHVNEFLNKRISYNPCNVQRGISIHMVKFSEQFDLWKKLLDRKSKCK